jgi:hypothetical protein
VAEEDIVGHRPSGWLDSSAAAQQSVPLRRAGSACRKAPVKTGGV